MEVQLCYPGSLAERPVETTSWVVLFQVESAMQSPCTVAAHQEHYLLLLQARNASFNHTGIELLTHHRIPGKTVTYTIHNQNSYDTSLHTVSVKLQSVL